MSTITPVSIKWKDADRPAPGLMTVTTALDDAAVDDIVSGESSFDSYSYPGVCVSDGPAAYGTALADFGQVVNLAGKAWRTTVRAQESNTILATCGIVFGGGERPPDVFAAGVTIEGSINGSAWTEIDGVDLTQNPPAGHETVSGTFGTGITARYVRFVYVSSVDIYASIGTVNTSVYVSDIRLSGDTIPPPPSPPAAPVIAEEHACPAGQAVIGVDTYAALLTWAAVTDAMGYRVYRDGVLVADVGAPWFLDAGRALAATYGYVVRAHNTAGESGNSNEVSVLCCSPPGAPTGLQAVRCCEAHTIRLSWEQPEVGYLPIQRYELRRDGVLVYNGASHCFVDDGTVAPPNGVSNLDDYTSYSYTLTATSACGTGPGAAVTARSLWSRRQACGGTEFGRRSGHCECS